jgi:uncharacterized protein DUF7007
MPAKTQSVATPWGEALDHTRCGDGVDLYITGGHGGIHLSPERNCQVPGPLRQASGWYEEDCEANKVVITFPDLFTEAQVELARVAVQEWFPAEYGLAFGRLDPAITPLAL